jgi:ABC-2 type transport system permease protein
MKNILLIAWKDLRSYFQSPIAYIVISVFVFVMGFMFFNLFSYFILAMGKYSGMSFEQKPTLSDTVIRPLFGNMNVVLLFVAPFITMRLVAEERKDHTIELLLTAPIHSTNIVFGKFLGGLSLLLILVSTSFAVIWVCFF